MPFVWSSFESSPEERKVLRATTCRTVLGLSPVVLLVFQELFVGAWFESEDGKVSPELG